MRRSLGTPQPRKVGPVKPRSIAFSLEIIPIPATRSTKILFLCTKPSKYFNSLGNFQSYLRTSNKYLMPFRFLFPLADPGHMVPDELRQSCVKPLIDQIEAVFKLTFSEGKPALSHRRLVSSRLL